MKGVQMTRRTLAVAAALALLAMVAAGVGYRLWPKRQPDTAYQAGDAAYDPALIDRVRRGGGDDINNWDAAQSWSHLI